MELLGFGGMLELPLVMAVLIAVNGLAVAAIARLVWDTHLGFIPWFGLVLAAIVVEMFGIYLVGTMIDRFRARRCLRASPFPPWQGIATRRPELPLPRCQESLRGNLRESHARFRIRRRPPPELPFRRSRPWP